MAQNTLTHDRIDLGRLVSATAEPLAVVTAAASSERSNRIYFAANTSASNRAALYVLDCLSLGLAGQ